MGIPEDSDRMRFSSTLRKDLYHRLKESPIPISRQLDEAVEDWLSNKKVLKIDGKLYDFLKMLYGLTNDDVDEEIEKLLFKHADNMLQNLHAAKKRETVPEKYESVIYEYILSSIQKSTTTDQ